MTAPKPEPKPKRVHAIGTKKAFWAELAERFNVDPSTIANAERAGAPVNDVNALAEWFANQRKTPGEAKIASISDAKLEKLRLECHRLKIKIDEDLKRLMPVDEMRRVHLRIASAMRSDFMRFVGDIPNWSGLPPAEIKRRCDEKLDRLFSDLAQSFDELTASFEETPK